jgi:hypothetical protein
LVGECWQAPAISQLSAVQGFPSSQLTAPDAQPPPEHASPTVQAFPSEHMAVLLVKEHPVTGSQLSSVHGLPSLQTSGVPAVQVPAWHVSSPLHRLVSAQLTPVSCEKAHCPFESQDSAVQGFESVHATQALPPLPQASFEVAATQLPDSRQVVQQTPCTHLPGAPGGPQGPPSLNGLCTQAFA